MKIVQDKEHNFISIDFKEGIEAKSIYENGIIVRFDKKGSVIGIDITDPLKLLATSDTLTLQEACKLLGVSEATLRRKIKQGKIRYTKPNGKDYRFKRSDILKLVA